MGIYSLNKISDASGIAYMNAKTSINAGAIAHELGHNFGRKHINCGNPDDPDIQYPYPGNSMGSLGVDIDLKTLLQPNEHPDLMGYCADAHISDYTYEAV